MSFQIPPYALYYDDEAEVRDAYWCPEAGDQVVDVGARYGSYTIPALAAGATVLAIDPHSEILGLLQDTAILNGFDGLTTMCAGLLDGQPYPAELAEEVGAFGPDSVNWTTLDEVAPDRVDWIKIDVEGAELAVLNGGLATLERDHPRLLIEDHTRVYGWCRKNQVRRKVYRLLQGLGYKIRSVPYEADTGAPRDFTVAT